MEDVEATRRWLSLAEDEGTRRVHNPLNHSGVSDEVVDMLDEGSSECESPGGSYFLSSL